MKNRMVKSSLLAIAILLTLTLSACGKSTSGDGKISLELWHTWTEDRPENTVYKEKVEAFNKEHDDIEVELVGIPNDDIETKLRTQATANKLPDMFKGYPGERMKSFVDAEKVMPIDSIMDNWKDKIPEGLLKDFNFDGKQYAIPGNISQTSLVYYHKDMLKDIGYEAFPTYYNDFKEMIGKLNESDITPIALGNKAPWVLQSCYMSTIGDRFTGSDFIPDALNGGAAFTEEQFVNSLSVIQELVDIEAFNENFNTIDEAKSRSNFIEDQSAMHVAGSWALGPILEEVSDVENIGVAPFPEIEGGNGEPGKVSGVIGGGIYLNSDLEDEKEEAAKEFLEFFYDDALYEDLAKANILVPVEVESDELEDLYTDINDIGQNGLAPVYDAILPPKLTDEINKGGQSITTESITPEELAKNMQQILEDK